MSSKVFGKLFVLALLAILVSTLCCISESSDAEDTDHKVMLFTGDPEQQIEISSLTTTIVNGFNNIDIGGISVQTDCSTTSIGSDITSYDLVIVLLPTSFDSDSALSLKAYVQSGGYAVFIGGNGSFYQTSNSYLSSYANYVGLDFTIDNQLLYYPFNVDSISELMRSPKTVASLTPSTPSPVSTTNSYTTLALGTPGSGPDMSWAIQITNADLNGVAFGDYSWIAPTGGLMDSNAQNLFENILNASINAKSNSTHRYSPIFYHLSGGYIAELPVSNMYEEGTASVTFPTDVRKSGMAFTGWYDNDLCTGTPKESIDYEDTGDMNLWAGWTDEYSIEIQLSDSTVIPFESIEKAVSVFNSNSMCVLSLLENVTVTDELVLTSSGTIKLFNHILDAEGNCRIFHISKNISVMICNGTSDTVNHYYRKSGDIYIFENDGKSNPLGNCTTGLLANGKYNGQGGAIYNEGSLTLEYIGFIGNTSYSGGAIYSSQDSTLSMQYTTFDYNSSKNGSYVGDDNGCGGAVTADSITPTTFAYCTFTNGTSVNYGGGIYFIGSNSITLLNCTIGSNYSKNGGGIASNDSETEITIYGDESSFSNNSAEEIGGFIYSSGPLTVNEGTFTNNRISGSSLTSYGGCIYSMNNLTILNGIFSGNSADYGGAIYSNGTLTIESGDTYISRNEAQYGGGLFISGNTEIYSGTISENTVTQSGGGLFVISGTSLRIISCTIKDNTAGVWGGGLICYSDTEINDVAMSGNQAQRGSALTVDNCQISITEGLIENNEFIDKGDKWSVYGRNNASVSLGGNLQIKDGVKIESSNIYLCGSPSILNSNTGVSPLYICDKESMIYGSSTDSSSYFVGSVTFIYESSVMTDGTILVRNYFNESGSFNIFNKAPEYYLYNDAPQYTLIYSKYAAKINSNYYPTLSDALNCIGPDDTIDLLKDAELSSACICSYGLMQNLRIDGHGFTVNDTVDGTVFTVYDGGLLSLKDLVLYLSSGTKADIINISENGTVILNTVTINGYSCSSVINITGGDSQLTLSAVTIKDNTVTGSAVTIVDCNSVINITGENRITDNKDTSNTEKDITLKNSGQLIMTGQVSGNIGIDYNNGLGLIFGITNGYSGAESFFNTASDYIIGSANLNNLVWAGRTYDITYHLYNDVTDFGTYIYGTAFILPTTYQRKGFDFSGWLDSESRSVTQIEVGENGDKDFYAQWYQSEIFVSSKGHDDTGEGTSENPFLTLNKAYSVAVDGNTIAILTDITVNSSVEFNNDSKPKIILCSENGLFSLIRGTTLTDYMIIFSTGQTTLMDIKLDGNGTIDGRNVDHSLISVQQEAKLILGENTEVCNNEISKLGVVGDSMGGGITLYDSAVLCICEDAYIRGNYAYSGSAINATGSSSIVMTGGTITGNYNYDDSSNGAVILSTGLQMTISGTVIINENYNLVSELDPISKNLYLAFNAFINISEDGITDETNIHISIYSASQSTDVLIVKGATSEMTECFIPDDTTRNALFCDGTENEFNIYHHFPCVANSIYLTCEIIHVHSYTPSFTWSADYTSVMITLVCQGSVCQKTIIDNATVTHEQISVPDCTSTGLIIHTASYTYSGHTYLEYKNETLEALGHISDRGYCSRDGCGIELFDADYIVRLDGHYKYTSIQDAVDDAKADQVLGLITDITMDSNVIINKSISIESYYGSFKITRGYNGSELFTVSGNSTISIRNITFDGNGSEYVIDCPCGVINIYSGSTVDIRENTVFINTVTSGDGNHGAVLVNGGTLNLYAGTFTDNYSQGSGAAIFSSNASKIYLKGNVIIKDNYRYTEGDMNNKTQSNVSYTTADEFIFDCEEFTGTLSVDFNNTINENFGIYVNGVGYETILNDSDVYLHGALDGGSLLWVADYIVNLYLGSEEVYKTPYYSLITTYMSTYGYMPDGELEGHSFIGWFTAINGGTQVFEDTVVYFQSGHNLYAHWDIVKYKLTVDKDNGEPADVSMVEYGTELSVPTPSKTGHTFLRWSKDIPETMPAEDVYVKAFWSVNTYSLKFDTSGGSSIPTITQAYGTAITAPADPTLRGHTFLGWDEPIPDTMPAENMTFTAGWVINTYTIIFDTDGGSYIAPMTVRYNDTIILPEAPTRAGYVFNNWENAYYSKMPDHDLYLKARWSVNYYKITFDTDGGSKVSSLWQPCDSAITKPSDPTRDGYIFVCWDTEIPDKMPAYNMNITALWIPRTDMPYTVQHLVQNSDGTYYTESAVSMTGTTDTQATVELKEFEHHYQGTYEPSVISSKGNTVIKVYYDITRSTVTFDTDGGSEVQEQPVLYGAKATAPSEPTKRGYAFGYWSYKGLEYRFNTPVYDDITLKAVWIGCDVTVLVTQDGVPAVANISVMSGSGKLTEGSTDSDGMITFKNLPFGTYNVKATSADGKRYTTVGAVFNGSIYNLDMELPTDKINTDITSNISNNVSVNNLHNAISESERESILNNEDVESLTLIMKLSEIDSYSAVQKVNGKIADIVESYDISIYKLITYTDSSTFRKNLSSSDSAQIITFEITDRMLEAMASKGYTYDNIIIYHTHTNSGGYTTTYAMNKMSSYQDLISTAYNGFCITEIDGQHLVTIKADEYSIYSFGLTEEDQNSTGTDVNLTYIALAVIVCVVAVLIIGYLCLRHFRSKTQNKD